MNHKPFAASIGAKMFTDPPETDDELLVAKDLEAPIRTSRHYPVPERTVDGRIRYRILDALGCTHYLEDGGKIELARFVDLCLDGIKLKGMAISTACFVRCSFKNTEIQNGSIHRTIFEDCQVGIVLVDTSVCDARITSASEGSHLRLHRVQVQSLLLEKCRQLKLDMRFSLAGRMRVESCEIIGGAWEGTEFSGLELVDTAIKNLRIINCRFPSNAFYRTRMVDSYVDGDFSLGLWTDVMLARVVGRIVADFSEIFEVDVRESLLDLRHSFTVLQSVQMTGSRINLTCSHTTLDAVGLWRCHGAVRIASSACRSLRANDSTLRLDADRSELLAPTVRRSRVRGELKNTQLIQAEGAPALADLLTNEDGKDCL